MKEYSDIELWILVKQGDSGAFEKLYRRYWEKFYTICYWHLLDQESAKDLVQEAFVDLWDKRAQIDISKTVEGYLTVTVRNKMFNHIRSLKIQKKYYDFIEKDRNEAISNVDEQSNERELKKLYHEEIGKLPPKMKDVFTLSKEQGLSITEIAIRLSLSEQTVKNQLGTALKRIRSGIEHYRLIPLLLWIYFIFFK